jgi:hypothetical protein
MRQAAQPAADRESLAGLVERVTFHNEESGFCVLRVKARGQRDLITVVGHAAAIGAGEFVQASGRWVNDRTHGVQFRADFLRAAPPTTAEGIEKYLASGRAGRAGSRLRYNHSQVAGLRVSGHGHSADSAQNKPPASSTSSLMKYITIAASRPFIMEYTDFCPSLRSMTSHTASRAF